MERTHYPNAPLGGSMKLKIVNPDLAEERAKLVFDKQEITDVVLDASVVARSNFFADEIVKHPEYKATEKWYDMTREEQMKHYWERIALMYKQDPELYIYNQRSDVFSSYYLFPGVGPLFLHLSMFTQCLQKLGSDE
jgi:hypothetical protein